MASEVEIFSAHRFHVEIAGISRASFVRCTGLSARRAVVAFREGGSETARKLRGPEDFSNLILEGGVTRDISLFEWYTRGDRREGSVILLGPAGEEVFRWNFSRAWPCRWEGPRLDAESGEVAIELLEITHEGLSWAEH